MLCAKWKSSSLNMRISFLGKRVLYSVQFYTKEGVVVYYSHAYTTGLHMNMKENRMRGIQQCDQAGNKIGHPVAVSIDNLRMFNNKKIVL